MKRRILALDMLRGVAALIVLFHHCFTHFTAVFAGLDRYSPALYRLAQVLSDLNRAAVLLFFLVSGFSIRLSVQNLDLTTAAGVNEHLYRRFKRILPLYLSALAISALVSIVGHVRLSPDALSLRTLLGNLLFLQTAANVPGGWFVPYADNGPLWSLSYEMFYYLLFPAHCAFVHARARRLITAWAITLFGLAFNQVFRNPIAEFAASYIIWYSGVELAQLYLGEGRLLSRSTLGFAVACALLSLPRVRHGSATLEGIWIGLSLFLLGLLALGWARRARIPRLIERAFVAPLAFCGSFSYALYLFHFPIIAAFRTGRGDDLSSLVAAVLASAGLALIAERLSLRPAYRFLQREYV